MPPVSQKIQPSTPQTTDLSLSEALRTWARIGLLSFGGPAGQISLMHRLLVEEKKWITETQYLNALSFCMLLPGPEAMQLATYVGWRLHGVKGGLAAGLLFVLPGACLILALSMIYASFGNLPLIMGVFLGIKAAVLMIVLEALLRVSRKALKEKQHWMIAGLSFSALFFFAFPFPLLILSAALLGYVTPQESGTKPITPQFGVGLPQTVRTLSLWTFIWFTPLFGLALLFGPDHVLTELSFFFSKLAIVTFGGAYAVLAYMAQDVVTKYSWLSAGAMLDGLGLAETTPGPLILVTEFVGYLAAYRHGGEPSWILGLLGAFVAVWATFIPCFLWIFVGAPYMEWITYQPRLKGALSAITAAVVGVILNLALWFALHVFFKDVTLINFGILKVWVPDVTSLDGRVVVLSLLSGFFLFVRHWNLVAVLALSSGLALLLQIVMS